MRHSAAAAIGCLNSIVLRPWYHSRNCLPRIARKREDINERRRHDLARQDRKTRALGTWAPNAYGLVCLACRAVASEGQARERNRDGKQTTWAHCMQRRGRASS